MLYILLGDDDFSRQQALGEIKKGLGDQSMLVTNTSALEGRQLTAEELGAVCATVPFLAEKRLVIVSGLLECFEARGKPRRTEKKVRAGDRSNQYQPFAARITGIPDSTVLVLVDGGVKNGNPLLKEISTAAKVMSFPRLKGPQLRQWVERRVKQEGSSISPAAVTLLTKLIGSELRTMASEINKLALFAQGRGIEAEDVRQLVSQAQEANVFAMVDSILESRAGVAEQLLQRLLDEGAVPTHLLALLLRQAGMIVRARELRKQRKSETEIQHSLGLTAEFVLHKVLEQADRYSMRRLIGLYRRLLDADLSIKTGKYSGELALNLLIVELCQRDGQ